MLLLLKGADIYAPEKLGKKDLLIAGSTIAAIEDQIEIESEHVQVIDCKNKMITPGFVDSLVHITGGGGEGGYTTRTPEVQLTDLTLSGITSLVAALGTDSVTRSLEGMLAKAKELNELGVSCFTYSGSYHVPLKTITGCLQKDICLISECIGVGEVAIADHRASQIDYRQLAKVASDARVGGMLSGKSGIVSIHMGDGKTQFDLLYQVAEKTDIPLSQFYPTHVNRSQSLLDAGVELCAKGGAIDFTTSSTESSIRDGEIKCSKGLKYFLDKGGNIERITFSSDGHASLPEFNSNGELTSINVGYESSLYSEVKDSVKQENIPIELALQTITSSPARILGLLNKGRLKVGFDADLNIIENSSMDINCVISQGRIMVSDGKAIVKGTFEL